jgi:hypothetical protein
MKYELTIFKSKFDNKTHRSMGFDSWDDFVSLLRGLSTRKGKKGGRNSSPLISPACFNKNTTRANKNVTHWGGWAAVDVDNLGPDYASVWQRLKEQIKHLSYICYSTASCQKDNPKFRLVFRTDRPVFSDEIRHFWFALNTDLGEIGDKQTKDLSRMYYIPAIYPNADNFFFVNEGEPLNVDLLKKKHPYQERVGTSFLDRLPPEFQKAVIEHRQNSMTNTSVRWTSYHDCPYWPRMLAVEYTQISGTGWYHKMYQIMVALAGNAIKNQYPITATQIADLCRQFDRDNGNWYENRPLDTEADRALEYVYRSR